MNVLESKLFLNLFVAPEHLNSWENELVHISGKMTWQKKQSPVRISFFLSRTGQPMSSQCPQYGDVARKNTFFKEPLSPSWKLHVQS